MPFKTLRFNGKFSKFKGGRRKGRKETRKEKMGAGEMGGERKGKKRGEVGKKGVPM